MLLDLMDSIVTGVQTSIIGEWITSGMKESPEELALFIAHIGRNISKQMFR